MRSRLIIALFLLIGLLFPMLPEQGGRAAGSLLPQNTTTALGQQSIVKRHDIKARRLEFADNDMRNKLDSAVFWFDYSDSISTIEKELYNNYIFVDYFLHLHIKEYDSCYKYTLVVSPIPPDKQYGFFRLRYHDVFLCSPLPDYLKETEDFADFGYAHYIGWILSHYIFHDGRFSYEKRQEDLDFIVLSLSKQDMMFSLDHYPVPNDWEFHYARIYNSPVPRVSSELKASHKVHRLKEARLVYPFATKR